MREVTHGPAEAEIVDNYRLDHLYTHPFRGGAGKYFTVVSKDDQGTPTVVEFEHPWPERNKIKTRLTFIKSEDGGRISEIEIKRFKFYARKGYVECEEEGKWEEILASNSGKRRKPLDMMGLIQ